MEGHLDAVFNRVGEIVQLLVRYLLSRVAISFYFGWPWLLAMGIYVYVAKPLCNVRARPVYIATPSYQVILPCFAWRK